MRTQSVTSKKLTQEEKKVTRGYTKRTVYPLSEKKGEQNAGGWPCVFKRGTFYIRVGKSKKSEMRPKQTKPHRK